MAAFLGISRVRVYQLIKAGLPLTSFEEASAWRAGRRPGHPRKMAIEMESKSINPIPGPNSAGPELAAPHTDTQFLNLHPVIKSLAQCCSPVDSHWEGLSSSLCSFQTVLLQLGADMQRAFGVSVSAIPGFDSTKIPQTAQCGILAARLQEVSKAHAELAAVEKRAAEQRLAVARAVSLSSWVHLNDSARAKSGDAFALKSPEKTSRKPSKQVEVVVDSASDDEENIDGVTDWIGALLQARHILPGAAHSLKSDPSANKCLSAASQLPREDVAEVEPPSNTAFCPLDDSVKIEDLRLQVAALQKAVDEGGSEISSLTSVRSSLNDNRSAKALALNAKLTALASLHSSNVEKLAEMEAQLSSWHECVEQALLKVPLDTRSQFLIEVCLLNQLFFRPAHFSFRLAICVKKTFGTAAAAHSTAACIRFAALATLNHLRDVFYTPLAQAHAVAGTFAAFFDLRNGATSIDSTHMQKRNPATFVFSVSLTTTMSSSCCVTATAAAMLPICFALRRRCCRCVVASPPLLCLLILLVSGATGQVALSCVLSAR
jgi:hypothetical protein